MIEDISSSDRSSSSLGTLAMIKSLYNDPFKWNLIKSVAITVVAIKISRQFKGLVFMPSWQADNSIEVSN